MIIGDIHTHTTYCDGKNTPEEMVRAAIDKGLGVIGFTGHSYTFFDTEYCMKRERLKNYRDEVRSLAKKYKDKITVLLGIEQDFYTDLPPEGYDYVIGSVHYIKLGEEYIAADDGNDKLIYAANKYFGGDIYGVAEEYFRTVSCILQKINADIIGHIDVITKYNEIDPIFDVCETRFVKAYKKAVDTLAESGKIFEVNTGAISRGVRKTPYPGIYMWDYLKQKDVKLILTGDSHSTDALCCQFDKWTKSVEEYGMKDNLIDMQGFMKSIGYING